MIHTGTDAAFTADQNRWIDARNHLSDAHLDHNTSPKKRVKNRLVIVTDIEFIYSCTRIVYATYHCNIYHTPTCVGQVYGLMELHGTSMFCVKSSWARLLCHPQIAALKWDAHESREENTWIEASFWLPTIGILTRPCLEPSRPLNMWFLLINHRLVYLGLVSTIWSTGQRWYSMTCFNTIVGTSTFIWCCSKGSPDTSWFTAQSHLTTYIPYLCIITFILHTYCVFLCLI